MSDEDSVDFDGETLSLRSSGHVAEITLNRPELMNRFDEPAHHEFLHALQLVRSSSTTRAIVFASTGDLFSAGGDFDFMLKAHDDLAFLLRHVDVGRGLVRTMIDNPVPIVAAVQGPAIGLGATVVLCCDAVVAAKSAFLSDPHVPIGLAAGDGGCLVWPAALGSMMARRYLLTGDRLPAERAYQLGLVTDLVDEPGDVIGAARALAGRIAALPPIAVQGTKRALNNVMQQRANEVLDLAFGYEVESVMSEDLVEAIAAFREKRPPNYQGR
ncbi:MAG: enoyl-CoA hydratase/isomerase family protein [Acidimicrobiales bacterium]